MWRLRSLRYGMSFLLKGLVDVCPSANDGGLWVFPQIALSRLKDFFSI